MMKIEFDNIILRDMIESDIEDYVRWFSVEREWENWDTPWENEDTCEEAERCAEKLGFVECNRNVGTREVDGQKYDGLTFKIKMITHR